MRQNRQRQREKEHIMGERKVKTWETGEQDRQIKSQIKKKTERKRQSDLTNLSANGDCFSRAAYLISNSVMLYGWKIDKRERDSVCMYVCENKAYRTIDTNKQH